MRITHHRDAGITQNTMGAHAYPHLWRIVAAALVTISRAGLPLLLVLVLTATDPPVTPPMLIRAFVILVGIPSLAAWLIARAFAVDVEAAGSELVVSGRDLRLEIPYRAIARVAPWAVPLPGPGVSLWMQSGRRLRYGLQLADPTPLLSTLAGAGGVAAVRSAMQHPGVVYAHAKQRGAPRRWYHGVAKFVLFALVPTLPLFRVHQFIAYGGPLGEYYLLGLASYLKTFALYWVTLTIYLLLYASAWRGVAEGAALLTAWVAPARAASARRAAEIACGVLYYGGVLVILVLRFLPW